MSIERILRLMAWERAKGELMSITQTYIGDKDSHKYDTLMKLLEDFIEKVEDRGLVD